MTKLDGKYMISNKIKIRDIYESDVSLFVVVGIKPDYIEPQKDNRIYYAKYNKENKKFNFFGSCQQRHFLEKYKKTQKNENLFSDAIDKIFLRLNLYELIN